MQPAIQQFINAAQSLQKAYQHRQIAKEFIQAALNLQEVYRADRVSRRKAKELLSVFQKQRVKTLAEFSKYQYLFSDSYQRLRGNRKTQTLTLFWEVIENAIDNKQSYQETYRQIEGIFHAYEVGIANRKDPTNSLKNIKRFESQIIPLFEDFKKRVLSELDKAPGITEKAMKAPVNVDLSQFSPNLDKIAQETLIDPGEVMIEAEIPKAYQAGSTFGSIQLGGTLEQRQAHWDKISTVIEATKGDFKGVSDATNKEIRRTIADGILNEKTYGEISRDIVRNVDNVGINRAIAMVHYETQQAVNQGIKSEYEDAGLGEEEMEWLACDDDHTCDDCRANDGKTIAEIGEWPPLDPFCRCTVIPRIKIPAID